MTLPLFPEATPEAALAVWREIEAVLPPPSETRAEQLVQLRESPFPLQQDSKWPGEQAPREILNRLAADIYKAADKCGFPNGLGKDGAARFDDLAKDVVAKLDINAAQAASGQGGMFRYISMQLVQAIYPWRYPNAFDSSKVTSARRLRNPYQDIIGRLWWQHRFFGNSSLPEDLIESVLGRPSSLGRDPRIAAGFVAALKDANAMNEASWRDLAKDFRIAASWLDAAQLDDASLRQLFMILIDKGTPVPEIGHWRMIMGEHTQRVVARVFAADGAIEIKDAAAAGSSIKSFRARKPGHLQINTFASMLGIDPELLTEIERGTCGPDQLAPVVRKVAALGCDLGDSVVFGRP